MANKTKFPGYNQWDQDMEDNFREETLRMNNMSDFTAAMYSRHLWRTGDKHAVAAEYTTRNGSRITAPAIKSDELEIGYGDCGQRDSTMFGAGPAAGNGDEENG